MTHTHTNTHTHTESPFGEPAEADSSRSHGYQRHCMRGSELPRQLWFGRGLGKFAGRQRRILVPNSLHCLRRLFPSAKVELAKEWMNFGNSTPKYRPPRIASKKATSCSPVKIALEEPCLDNYR